MLDMLILSALLSFRKWWLLWMNLACETRWHLQHTMVVVAWAFCLKLCKDTTDMRCVLYLLELMLQFFLPMSFHLQEESNKMNTYLYYNATNQHLDTSWLPQTVLTFFLKRPSNCLLHNEPYQHARKPWSSYPIQILPTHTLLIPFKVTVTASVMFFYC